MPKLIITILEPDASRVVDALRALPAQCDGAEVRVDAIGGVRDDELHAMRVATSKPLIYTRRTSGPGTPLQRSEIGRALAAGFDFVDVEIGDAMPQIDDIAFRVILSHHDYSGFDRSDGQSASALPFEMLASRTGEQTRSARRYEQAHLKIAVTPRTFEENLSILRTVRSAKDLTYFGMGTRGLYSRMLAPFFGSRFAFVARDRSSIGAPGQLTFDDALSLYGGDMSKLQRPDAIFAVVGNPAAHSRSPEIHNAGFRANGVNAVYAIAEVERFEEVGDAILRGDELAPRGVSITAPFKESAFQFATAHGAAISDRARRCRAINTLVRSGDVMHADNTDVDAFERVIDRLKPRNAAVVGAGGTARAALVALASRGVAATVYNRTLEKAAALAKDFSADARSLAELSASDADLLINTVTAGAGFVVPAALLRKGHSYVDVAYVTNHRTSIDAALSAGMTVVDGLEVLRIQAEAQSKMFVGAVRSQEARSK